MVRDALEAAQDTVQARVGNAREQAGETWDALESLFRSRVRKVLAELRVPPGDAVRELARRVAELEDTVERLAGRKGTPRARSRSTKAGGKARATTGRKPRRAAR
jgi:poly(hydroxyalkanoate) granule-associated protein